LKVVALFNDSDARILQSPRVRATDNEKAQLKIADKIPIATGSFGTPVGIGTATGAVGVNTQFTYTDVGVIMEITPRVHPDGQVTLKTVMEISNQSNTVIIGGIQQPVISTRRVEHTIRLADGEVNLMGGIMEQQDTITRSGTPFLGQIPLLHYLFSEEKKERITNEIVFLLIPHIVRSQELNDLNRRAFDVGTGQGIDLHIAGRQTVQPTVASAPAPAPAPAPASTMQANPAAAAQPRPTVTQPSAQPPATHPASQASPAISTPSSTSNAAPGATMLKLDPTSFSQQQGSSFTVNVMMAHGQDIASVPIQISYDPRILQFVNVSNGDFLARDGQPVALVHRDDPSAGKLQVTAQRPPGSSGVTGEGTVFSLVFTAKTKGTGNVSISVPGARNSQNQPLDVLGSQAAVTVN
jgi:general secretion pathway protein D